MYHKSPDALADLRELAERYTAAWCSHDADSVAVCYSVDGSLSINAGIPAVGRAEVSKAAQGFMTTFPDLKVLMDDVLIDEGRAIYKWTLIGTNTGPGGSGRRVRISGREVWRIGTDALIAESRGEFDAVDYQRQLDGSAD